MSLLYPLIAKSMKMAQNPDRSITSFAENVRYREALAEFNKAARMNASSEEIYKLDFQVREAYKHTSMYKRDGVPSPNVAKLLRPNYSPERSDSSHQQII